MRGWRSPTASAILASGKRASPSLLQPPTAALRSTLANTRSTNSSGAFPFGKRSIFAAVRRAGGLTLCRAHEARSLAARDARRWKRRGAGLRTAEAARHWARRRARILEFEAQPRFDVRIPGESRLQCV